MYQVIQYFTDLHDADHPYHVGDDFPREGITVTAERLTALAGSDNAQGAPLIEAQKPSAKSTQKVGGGRGAKRAQNHAGDCGK